MIPRKLKQKTLYRNQHLKNLRIQSQSVRIKLSLIDIQPADHHPGRDAPLWDKGNDRKFGGVPVIRKIQEGILRVGNITVNKRGRYVTVKGEVNMQEGLVEYLACGPRGKLHESVLKLNVDPFYLQIALLLIGLELGNRPPGASGRSRNA